MPLRQFLAVLILGCQILALSACSKDGKPSSEQQASSCDASQSSLSDRVTQIKSQTTCTQDSDCALGYFFPLSFCWSSYSASASDQAARLSADLDQYSKSCNPRYPMLACERAAKAVCENGACKFRYTADNVPPNCCQQTASN